MTRPKMDLTLRYADVMPLWQSASLNNGLNYMARDENKAISIMHRLHKVRVALRNQELDGAIALDLFVVRRVGREIIISKRETFDPDKLFTLDGRKIDYNDVLREVEETRRLKEALEAGRPLPDFKGPPPEPPIETAFDHLFDEEDK